MKIGLRRFGRIAVLAFLGLMASNADPQSIGGGVVGVVRDITGPVPQAEVRIKNVLTGQGRVWLTDDQGRYELREVPPGSYELDVSKDGYTTFKTPPSKAVHLKLAQIASVEDITLTVAPVQEQAKVEEKAVDVAMTDSRTSTLGTSFDESQIHTLPISARDVNNLALLATGVSDATSFSFANTLVAFAVSGSRGRDNNFIIDSVDNNDPLFGGAATQFTNDAIFSEFRILTGQFQAEYGRNSGSIVNVVSRQGERDFHSSLFWLGQNDALNAMTKVEKQSDLTKPARFYENRVGATVSGPIKRDSTWFFLSYQWDQGRNDLSSEYPVVATLPTADGLALLQSVNDLNPSPTLSLFLNDPVAGRVGNLNAPCGPVKNAAPNPNAEPCQTGTITLDKPSLSIPVGTYIVPRANVTDLRDHEAFARIDRNFGQRHSLFFRYLIDDFRIPLAPTASIQAEGDSFSSGLLPDARSILADRTQNFGMAWTWASSRSLNELRLAYSRVSTANGPLDLPRRYRGRPALTPTIEDLGVGAFPTDGFLTLGDDSQPALFNNNVYQLQENYSFVRGRHSFKAGVNFNAARSGLNQIPGDLGHYYYQDPTGETETDLQEFVDNSAAFASERFGNAGGRGGPVLPLREFDQFYFFQDDMRVSSRLTLNFGLRYENSSPSFNSVVENSASYPISQQKLGRIENNFAPRLGFALGLGRNTVLRGGYGIFYNPEFLDIALLTWQSGPVSPFVQTPVVDPLFGAGPTAPKLNSYPTMPFVPGDVLFGSTQDCAGNTLADGKTIMPFVNCSTDNQIAKNLRNPSARSGSLGIESQINRNFMVEATYFSSIGTNLFQRVDVNPFNFVTDPSCVFPACSSHNDPTRGVVTETTNGADSSYNALQVSATKRIGGGSFWNGLELSTAYTWSHAIDNASEIFGASFGASSLQKSSTTSGDFLATEAGEDPTPFAQNPGNTKRGERGNSSFDRRHRLALSFVWAFPSLHNRANILLGNWGASGVFTVQSGQPFSPLNGIHNCSDTGVLGDKRPNVSNPHAPASSVALINNNLCENPSDDGPGDQESIAAHAIIPGAGPYITPSGQPVDPSTVRFVQVDRDTPFGNAGRNILVGPSSANIDLSLYKTIPLGERFKLQLRIEAFDILNRADPGLFAGNALLAGDQRVSSDFFNPNAPEPITRSRLSGVVPENFLDAGISTEIAQSHIAGTYLSQKYVTTNSRRIQWSVSFSF